MINIKEVKDRGVLIEGRASGMGFTFLKKVGKNSYETVQPLSPCKDYLNEPVFTENTGIPSKAHGLVYNEKLNIFTDVFYMAIKIVKTKEGIYWYSKYENGFEVDIKNLKDNYKNIQNLLNFIENKIGIEIKTTIEEANDDYFLLTSSVEWSKSTPAISLYSLIIRCSLVYKGEDVFEYFKNYNYHNEDKQFLEQAIKKLNIIIENKSLPEQPSFDEKSAKSGQWSPHNVGIISTNIVLVEKAQVI